MLMKAYLQKRKQIKEREESEGVRRREVEKRQEGVSTKSLIGLLYSFGF